MTIANRVIQQFAARTAQFDQASRWAGDAGLLSAFVDATVPRHHDVLEVCCGTGQVGGALVQRGAHVVGVDLSTEMLAVAATRVQETVVADAHALPFSAGAFERVVLRQAWHFLDAGAVARELFRVTCPSGSLVTAQIVPFGEPDAAWLERIHRAKQADLLWFPTESAIAGALTAAGWELSATRELLIEEEMAAWLKWAPETGDKVPEVMRLVREAPADYKRLHRVREDATGLYDSFRWVLFTARRPGSPPSLRAEALALLTCPSCGARGLGQVDDRLSCGACHAAYPIDAGVARLRRERRLP